MFENYAILNSPLASLYPRGPILYFYRKVRLLLCAGRGPCVRMSNDAAARPFGLGFRDR
jgi:hypothetical protein